MEDKRTAIVTGCAGFIGKHFTSKCLEKGWTVLGIDKLTYVSDINAIQALSDTYQDTFCFEQADIVTLDRIPNCDYIFNFAAESHVANSIINADDFIESNIKGVQRLLELLRKRDNIAECPILVHISTDEVYGHSEKGAFKETDLLNPRNPYAVTKAAGDLLIQAWNQTYGIDYFIARPTNNYGWGQYPEKLIPIAVENLKRGKKINLHQKGEPIRNWLHVEDTCDAIFTIIEKGKINNIYNISGDSEKKNIDIAKHIVKYFHNLKIKDPKIMDYLNLGVLRPGQDLRYSLNDDKLRALGWKNKKSIDKELPNLVEHYRGMEHKW